MTSSTTEQAKKIEELILEGATWEEIIEKMGLSRQQIRYRLKSRYAENVCQELLKKIFSNEEKRKKEELENIKTKALVVDTCSTKAGNFFTILELYEKVYILAGTLPEFEKVKQTGTEKQKRNVRKLLKNILEDKLSQKYIIVQEENVSSYQDNNILNFCIQHREEGVVLYTDDAILAVKAKTYGIPYEMANEEAREDKKATEKKAPKPKTKKKKPEEKPIVLTQQDLQDMKNAMQGNSLQEKVIDFSDETLVNIPSGISFVGNSLILSTSSESDKSYYIVTRNNKIVEPISNLINLKLGDEVYHSLYNEKYNNIQVNRYVIVKEQPQNYAVAHDWYRVWNLIDLNRLPYEKNIKKKIEMHFKMHHK